MPRATLVLNSGDQIAELIRPINKFSDLTSQAFLHADTGGPDIEMDRICRQGPLAISFSKASLPMHFMALRVSQNLDNPLSCGVFSFVMSLPKERRPLSILSIRLGHPARTSKSAPASNNVSQIGSPCLEPST